MPKAIVTILIIVGVYYGIKYLAKFLFPVLMKRFMNKMTDGQFGQFQQQAPPEKPEGEVTISKTKGKNSNPSSIDGDYVDFEEVKDE